LRRFDLLAGTSIGGIIALELAAGRSATEIKSCFEANGTRIFSDRPAPRHWWGKGSDFARSLWRPKYDNTNLRAVINDLVGEGAVIGGLSTPVLVMTLNVSKGQRLVIRKDAIDFIESLRY
jgi:patatin-like phospholipase/acyl hydrolase